MYYFEQEFYPNGFKITALFEGKTTVKVRTEIIDKNYIKVILDGKEAGDMIVCMTPAIKSNDGLFESSKISAAWKVESLEEDSPLV